MRSHLLSCFERSELTPYPLATTTTDTIRCALRHHVIILHCTCRMPESGKIIQCEVCYQWYLHLLKGHQNGGSVCCAWKTNSSLEDKGLFFNYVTLYLTIMDPLPPPSSHIIPYWCMLNVYIVILADTPPPPPPPLLRDVIYERPPTSFWVVSYLHITRN